MQNRSRNALPQSRLVPGRPRTWFRPMLHARRLRPMLALTALSAFATSCSTATLPPEEEEETVELMPGDVCVDPTNPQSVKARFEPARVYVAPCTGGSCPVRKAELVVDPDFCSDQTVEFKSSDGAIVPAPETDTVGLYKPIIELDIRGGSTEGSATITAKVPKPDGTFAEAVLEVEVLDPTLPTCAGTAAAAPLMPGETLRGEGDLAGVTFGLPEGANLNENGFTWGIEPFETDITCDAEDITVPGHVALGPPVTFGPVGTQFPRDLPMSIPINPAALPELARWRHLAVAYTGPKVPEPRIVPIANPRIERVDGQWALSFMAPRLGTYQAMVRADAGTEGFKRRITHRAAIGVSMGGLGSSMFGMRNHHLFDVLAPLGGPGSWSWLLNYINTHHIGGFRTIEPGTTLEDIQIEKTTCMASDECAVDETCLGAVDGAAGRCTLLLPPTDTFEHPQTFNNWWAEYPRTGVGGRFPRDEYAQIFRDLALAFGNPNGENLIPGAMNLPAGVRPDDASVTGAHPNDECRVWVDPLDGPDKEQQEQIANSCPVDRCSNPLTLESYFDDEYNPDGAFPVITVCDGTPVNEALTPWANTWTKEGPNNYPLEVGLAVDYNANGVRDELEPIIRAGHEPWDDTGEDGLPSSLEPGYIAGVNEDPNQDDFHPQYNPGGTEGDFVYQLGEPFEDVGLDGIAGTPQQPAGGWQQPGDGYDVGEGDGVFTQSRGRTNMLSHDPRAIVRQDNVEVPGGELTDEALRRIDVWTDGGTRDIFNFGVAAQHLAGAFVPRGRNVTYFTHFTEVPGLDPLQEEIFLPSHIVYEDLSGIVFQRYGAMVPSDSAFEYGSGQHVGTVFEIASRLQGALYFIGSRWSEPHLRTRVEDSDVNPAPDLDPCEINGTCEFEFTATDGRVGPVSVSLPPGYGHADQQDRRYPVIYMLHGYGQTPEDLQAAILFLKNWMNSPADSMASRLPKAIVVYVDGRCRVRDDLAECIRGNFYVNSAREDGVQAEQWWLELMDHVDQRYRTLGETHVDWVQ